MVVKVAGGNGYVGGGQMLNGKRGKIKGGY